MTDLTPLERDLYHPHPDTIRTALQQGTRVHVINSQGRTPLHHHIHVWTDTEPAHQPLILHMLLQAGACPNTVDQYKRTPLQDALHLNEALIDVLLRAGALIKHPSSESSALHDVISMSTTTPLLLLLKYTNADALNCKDSEHFTTLQRAIQKNYPSHVKILLAHGASLSLEEQNPHTQDTLRLVQSPEIAQMLLDLKGPDLNGPQQTTLLHYATHLSIEKSLAIVKICLQAGVDIHATNTQGRTAFHESVIGNRVRLAQYYLEQGMNPNLPLSGSAHSFRRVPLLLTTHPAMVQLLLEHGADPNLPRLKSGRTLLHYYANTPQLEALLLQHGADPTLEDKYGEVPMGAGSQAARVQRTIEARHRHLNEHLIHPTSSRSKPRL